MIHYHGTPISGKINDATRFLNSRHALVSHQYPQNLGAVVESCSSFILDNGAYTIWRKGGTIDLQAYYRWVDDLHKHPGFDWALIPDVIDGTEDANDALLLDWPSHLQGVPVYHIHEDISRLVRLAGSYRVVALGSSGEFPTPNSKKWWERMSLIMDTVCDDLGRPPCKLHGLRMLNPGVFQKLPLASADSVNAGINNNRERWKKFGNYAPPTAWQRSAIIADRIESFNSAPCWGGLGYSDCDIGLDDIDFSEDLR